jgi:glutaredoxin
MQFPDIEVIGAPWCGSCKAIRKKLTALDLPYRLQLIAAGPKGWEYVEERTGVRAIPAVFINKQLTCLKEFVRYIDSLGLSERELTEEELDDIDE